jgi:ribose 5-phosphate isomerase A
LTADDQKRAAAVAAVGLVEAGMTVGIGTGTTAAWFARALGEQKLGIRGVATSRAAEGLARSVGVELVRLDDAGHIDLTVDGADEIGPGLSLIKGGGAALLGEKLVWRASIRCVVIADQSKLQEKLGKFPLPVEVVAFGHTTTAGRISAVLEAHGFAAPPLLRTAAGAPVKTDAGNVLYDVACGAIDDPQGLGEALKAITGVVDHGLFLDLADEALIGTDDGVITLPSARS